MRRAIIVILFTVLLATTAHGAEIDLSIPGLDTVEEIARDYGVEEGTGLEEGLAGVIRSALDQLETVAKRSLRTGIKLLGVALLCTLAQGICPDWGKGGIQVVEVAGALAITALTISDMDAMIGLGRETLGNMNDFSSILLPVMATLTAATGGITGAVVRQGATVLFSNLLIFAMNQLLIPLIYTYVATCCAYAAVGNEGLKKLSDLIRSGITFALTGFLLLFVGYLSASGAIAGTADAAAVRTAKLAISRAIPVVGGILSDAAESVLVGAGLLKNTVGIVGLLVVLAICIVPFLQLAFHYLVYKVMAALTGTVADMRLCKLIDSIGGAFGLVLGMTGAGALVLLVSLVSAISAVVP